MDKTPHYTATWYAVGRAVCQLRSNDEQEINELAWRLKDMSWFGQSMPDEIRIARVNNGDSDLLDILSL